MVSLEQARDALAARRPRLPDLLTGLFGPQRAFVEDDSAFVTAVCSRRAGKSHGAASRLLNTALRKPRAPVLYFTLTRGNAKRIMWQPLLEANRRDGLGFEPVESDLILKRNGVARIYLTGCDNQTEIGKMRGSGWGDVIGDEAQEFPNYIEPLCEDVLMPALTDFEGSLRLAGTPGPVPVGYFHKAAHSSAWSHHAWTVFENPYMAPQAQRQLARTLKLRGIGAEHPSIQREFYGRWAYDPSALVFRWSAANGFSVLPDRRAWQHVIGVDLGHDDADAIAVLAWSDASPALYLVREDVLAKQTITQLGQKLAAMREEFDPLGIVVDTGGLGKKIAHEITMRTGVPLGAAEKERKLEHIELLNDALRSGRFFAKADSRFAHDALLMEWERPKPGEPPLEKPKVSDRYHSDICDAVLYAYRKALHWLHVPQIAKPAQGSREWLAEQEKELEADIEQQVIDKQSQLERDRMEWWAQ